MSVDASRVSDGSKLLSPSKEYLRFCEHTDIFLRKLNSVKEVIRCRGDIFNQKQEKYQHLKDFQIKKVEEEKRKCLKKSEDLSLKIEKNLSELSKLNQTFSQLKVKLNQEKEKNETLKEKVNKLQSETKKQDEAYNKTFQFYLTKINLYEDFLKMRIDIDKTNPNVVSITFKNDKTSNDIPQLKIEKLKSKKFKVREINYVIQDLNAENIITAQELMLLLYNLQKQLYTSE